MAAELLRARAWRKGLEGGETKPQIFECEDDDEWVLKLPDNPHQGRRALCADWIGTLIARALGLPVLECQMVELDAGALSTVQLADPIRAWAQPGVCFGSKFLRSASPVLGLNTILQCAAPGDLARIVVSDTWLDVLDRKKPSAASWNLMSDSSADPPTLIVIDYGMGLQEALGVPLIGSPPMKALVPDGWLPHLHGDDIGAAIALVEALPTELIDSIVASLPDDWKLPSHVVHMCRHTWWPAACNSGLASHEPAKRP
jgi:hypothetical protein